MVDHVDFRIVGVFRVVELVVVTQAQHACAAQRKLNEYRAANLIKDTIE